MFIKTAYADVNIDRTRIVIGSSEYDTELNIVNSGFEPKLIQLWTDEGDVLASPSDISTEVIALPPIFILMPNEKKNIRIVLNRRELIHQEVEYLRWLNILQIPQKNNYETTDKKVLIPIRYRVKVLVRPEGLDNPNISDYKKLSFHVVDDILVVENMTKWYVNLLSIQLLGQELGGATLPPLERLKLSTSALDKDMSFGEIKYTVILDDGGHADFISQATRNVENDQF
ncbi:fimbria/pilus periplasmic chaperone [Vibrio sp. SCSIO 43140]|uniref:fimbria/pilus periplasmic chaperone n=1 Tax=Vibrio sp. SCSIO 43140 TaxID=2819100 RepID=UPI0020766039|nr:fimbria/pilus periplasmic chaperone [Vibrio sp. SCSIO 43140]USD61319.1 fimbria/pilus periplasmic chaperone [Vibrio sp. SCSIO 43140]